MSDCILSERNVAKSKKAYRCVFCGDRIELGSAYVRRTGIWDGDRFTMRMHPECCAYEPKAGLTAEDYEDMSEPSWDRKTALEAFRI